MLDEPLPPLAAALREALRTFLLRLGSLQAAPPAWPAHRVAGHGGEGHEGNRGERSTVSVTRFGLQIPSFTYPGVEDRDLFTRITR